MTTTTRASKSPAPDGHVRSRRATLLRLWAPASVLVGAVLWWPVGFLGLESWLHLPLDVFKGDVLFLGATAAAASVSLVVRSPWPRLAIVLVFSALGWVLDGPTADGYPHERMVLVALLGGGALLGIVLGARGAKGVLAAATVLAVVAGVSPTTWPRGLALALALALPFVVATWQRVAPTLLSLVRLVVTWLLFALLAKSLSYGWDTVRPGKGGVPVGQQARTVAHTAWDFARTQWWTHSQALLTSSTRWFVIAAVLAVVVVVVRAGRGALRRRATKP
ncbi:hypothetical protein ABEG17_10335 [Pedococcus sp. KACC 23699]|uniref:Uncharacterized protein n=1 Tax=Pedococcus sp. KACC 23699 TaxID=3149228 RepID=A0AAU7JPA1_9MICO